MKQLLCMLGLHTRDLKIDEPKNKGAVITFAVQLSCKNCPKVYQRVEYKMSFGPSTAPPATFDLADAGEIDG